MSERIKLFMAMLLSPARLSACMLPCPGIPLLAARAFKCYWMVYQSVVFTSVPVAPSCAVTESR